MYEVGSSTPLGFTMRLANFSCKFLMIIMKPLISTWTLPIALTLTILIISSFGETGREALQYIATSHGSSDSVFSYRWISAHFTHLGWKHAGLNLVGLISIWFIYGKVLKPKYWLVFIVTCAFGISLGLSVFSSNVTYYVGLSGVLHGMLALPITFVLLGAFSDAYYRRAKFQRWDDIYVALALWGKIAYELIIGSVPITSTIAGGAVIVETHLYGACIGTVFAFLLYAECQTMNRF